MTIKLVTKLPEDQRLNGLAGMRLADDVPTELVVVARMESTSVSHLFHNDDDVFTLVITEIESLSDANAKEAEGLMRSARAERTGEYELEAT
jgi:hypothetical protein